MYEIPDAAALAAAKAIADQFYDGHMTVMKFTTGWRLSFGAQPVCRDDINAMPEGATLHEALAKAITQLKG